MPWAAAAESGLDLASEIEGFNIFKRPSNTAQSIDIKEGAVFDGRLNMLKSSVSHAGSSPSSGAGAQPGAKGEPSKS